MKKPCRVVGKITKVDEDLGVVFGWAIICKIDGEPYFDTEGDHIPEAVMLDATVEFMASDRVLGDMHKEAEGGTVLFAFPMTEEIAKSFSMTTEKTGLMVGAKPEKPETLEKFKDGTYSGFSIGGWVLEYEEAA